MNIEHPFFKSVEVAGTKVNVQLSGEFPIGSFFLKEVLSHWAGMEIAANVGLVNSNGEIDWVRGTGLSVEEATNDALQMFLNLVVSPEDVTADDFKYRNEGEIL